MGRSLLFRHLRRTLQVAQWCNRLQLPTREGLEIAAQARGLDAVARRDFLKSMGSTLALGTLGMLKVTQASGDTNTTHERLGTRSSGRQLEASIGIVGAGLAGLTCARELQRWGLKPVVYEASDHVGGRCYSLNDVFPNQVVERGGELIDTTHTTMRSLAQEFGLTVENLERVPGETFYHFIGQRHSEIDVVDEYRALVPALHTDLRHLGSPTADDFSPYDQELDFTDLATYLDTRGASDLINAVLDVTYTIEYGLGIDRQSCLNLLFFIHADRRSKWTPFGVFSDERYHVVEGNQRIPESLALTLQKPVTFARTLVRVARTTAGRIELTFVVQGRGSTQTVVHDAVVLTVPFSVLRHVELDASLALPDWKRYAIDHLGYGTNAKLMLGFHGPFWRAQGSNGDSYSDLTYHQNTWETNPSRATGTSAVLTDYTGGELGASLNPKNPQRDADRFLTDLEELYPGAGNAAIRNAHGDLLLHLEHWPSNPLSMGSYTCSQPGYFTTIAGNEGKPVGNLFFAGEHTNSFYEYQGFMEGACLSGLQAAADLLDLLR